MSVRAKFYCHTILLTQASRVKDGLHWNGKVYVDQEGNEYKHAEASEHWHQPTVRLSAVYVNPADPNPDNENAAFFAATPSASCEITISNPHAAEFFELGESYYLDFSRAPK